MTRAVRRTPWPRGLSHPIMLTPGGRPRRGAAEGRVILSSPFNIKQRRPAPGTEGVRSGVMLHRIMRNRAGLERDERGLTDNPALFL
jgi:hypothetical protein